MLKCALQITMVGMLAGVTASNISAAPITLDFTGLNPGNEPVLYLSQPVTTQGFTLTSTGATPGFNTYGSNLTNFFAGTPALSPLIGDLVRLQATDGTPFSLLSIGLGRNFAFDPAPTVAFTATRADGSTVNQSLLVTLSVGTSALQPFTFSGFSNVVSVTWNQASTAEAGLHQFGSVTVDTGSTAVVPEPSSLLLFVIGAVGLIVRHGIVNLS